MKNKCPGTLLIIGVFVLVVFVIPLALFSTLSGTFVPPAPDSPEARVPDLPYPLAQAAAPSTAAEAPAGEIPAPDATPDGNGDSAAEILGDENVKKLFAAFRARHPNPPDEAKRLNGYPGVPGAYSELALAILMEEEPSRSFFTLLAHPNSAVRWSAVHGLLDADNALRAEGAKAVIELLADSGEAERNALVRAATETLIADTQAGRTSNAQMLLMFLGEYAQPAIPHLVWASRNHPDANMRVFAMNTVYLLDPNSDSAREAIQRGLGDASGTVRLQALQAWVLRPLEAGWRRGGGVPPVYLQRAPGGRAGGTVTADVPSVPAEKSAAVRAI